LHLLFLHWDVAICSFGPKIVVPNSSHFCTWVFFFNKNKNTHSFDLGLKCISLKILQIQEVFFFKKIQTHINLVIHTRSKNFFFEGFQDGKTFFLEYYKQVFILQESWQSILFMTRWQPNFLTTRWRLYVLKI